MKQVVILSGKGGTGKTSITAAFTHLVSLDPTIQAALVDADVDAANLELVLEPQIVEKHVFIGGKIAVIDEDVCLKCGTCKQTCRFDAIKIDDGAFRVDPFACEGCSACMYQCPIEAIHMQTQVAGHWFYSNSIYGPLFHAALRPAQENSGKLVSLVKQQAHQMATAQGYPLILVDGPPGIGCPVISAVSGVDLALIVTEPTAAGVHDMERVLETTGHFHVPSIVCINKADINPAQTEEIKAFCREREIDVVGCVPFDAKVTESMVQGKSVTAHFPDSEASKAISQVWQKLVARLKEMTP